MTKRKGLTPIERSEINRQNAAMKPTKPLSARFWGKVSISADDDCWPWLGAHDGHGYGIIAPGQRGLSPLKATHVALALAGRALSPGENALHTCDNPPCVNERHLFAGDQRVNLRDARDKGRLNPKSLLNLLPMQRAGGPV